jgi:predicted lipoprotein with Yx(FWY)xxD motif
MDRTVFYLTRVFLAGSVLAILIYSAACTQAPPQPASPAVSPTPGSGQSPSASQTPVAPPTAVSSPTPSITYSFGVSNSPTLGSVLTDGKGVTLYYNSSDSKAVSNVAGDLLKTWPVFYIANAAIPPQLSPSDFGAITRQDGQEQSTYIGYPLYYYALDTAPGSTLGQGIGGVWFVVIPQLFPTNVPHPISSPTPITPTASPTAIPSSSPSVPASAGVTIDLTAQNFQFDKKTITVPAGAVVSINFVNKDANKMHNFSVYKDKTASVTIFVGASIGAASTTTSYTYDGRQYVQNTITTPAVDHVTYTFTPPPVPGIYYFRDDNYPTTMNGDFIVQ